MNKVLKENFILFLIAYEYTCSGTVGRIKEYLVFVKVSKGLVNIKIFVEDLIFVELNKFGLNIILSFTFKNNSLPSYIPLYIPLFGNSGIIGYPGKLAIRTSLPLIVIFV